MGFLEPPPIVNFHFLPKSWTTEKKVISTVFLTFFLKTEKIIIKIIITKIFIFFNFFFILLKSPKIAFFTQKFAKNTWCLFFLLWYYHFKKFVFFWYFLSVTIFRAKFWLLLAPFGSFFIYRNKTLNFFRFFRFMYHNNI